MLTKTLPTGKTWRKIGYFLY